MSLEGKKLGFIGTGKMGSALIKGICNAGLFAPSNVYASDLYEPSLDELKKNVGVNVSTDNAVTVINSDIIVLAVKPQILKKVISGIKDDVSSDKLIISIAAGVKLEDIEKEFNEGTRVIRVMPNIAATVAEAASAITQGKDATKEDAEDALEILSSVGSAIQVPENLMDAVTGLSGSGPAYIFPVIEAMADGAVYEGLDRNSALILAAQTVLGAAKMVLETGAHPGELKDMVTSPAGTTIRGVRTLEDYGVRIAFMNAVIESANRSKQLGK
ncbi:pyrroline-5-carboxylate reductase [Methanolobus bombayensis]|uniref:pyrroline-5-carboxylate reductase n=1 Tax=Methanolobus bombayensis TaxID=38023 RepID=UPI001AE30115|nr:pyrroline-5-carboxylate reductase [Methanolobus bombayensis]MBP1907978.1 pyrroline-5-carboxylate reductase [Methanolobus bombayensis]